MLTTPTDTPASPLTEEARDQIDEILSSYNEQGEIISSDSKATEGGTLPHGNGYAVDPRQQVCWDFYVESLVQGKPDATKAAIKAGYGKDFAQKVSKTKWFVERKKKLKRSDMMSKAEQNLKDILNLSYIKKRKVGGEFVEEVDTDVLKIVIDVSKTIVKSLGKDEGYSDRSEITGKSGEPIVFMPYELLAKHGLTETTK